MDGWMRDGCHLDESALLSDFSFANLAVLIRLYTYARTRYPGLPRFVKWESCGSNSSRQCQLLWPGTRRGRQSEGINQRWCCSDLELLWSSWMHWIASTVNHGRQNSGRYIDIAAMSHTSSAHLKVSKMKKIIAMHIQPYAYTWLHD